MANEYGWNAFRYWASKLERKYPRTNLATLSREELCEMLMSLKEAEGMPPLPDEKAYFSALTDAWLEIQYGRDSSKDIPDAYK